MALCVATAVLTEALCQKAMGRELSVDDFTAVNSGLLLAFLLPAAAPSIVTGMRLGLGVAWMCLVAAEMMPGSISGIGYVITHAYTVARTDIVVAGMISIGAMGLAIDAAFRRFEEKCFAWQRLSR